MQSLNVQVARAQADDRVRAAALRRAVPPSRSPAPPGARPLAVLAARVARRLDADAARGVLRA